MVGRTISHYQIVEKLGTGGMGEIYKALDPRLNRFVAIKVLPAGMSADPARRRRFIQEAQAASGLNHPNIITIYDVVSEHETEFMVMEFVAGKTLQDLIPKGGLRAPQVLGFGVQMADALGAAHAAGIIHRDLKPGNVMVTDSGLVKILDFGLAKLDRHAVSPMGDDAETMAADALTIEGSILGTVSYMSPEQAQGKRVDARSDIFSFGVLLYEMATGVRPFAGESAISTLSSILRDEARPLVEIAPDVPARLQEVISRCLRKDPDARWQSMKEVHAELMALKQESDSGTLYRKPLAPVPRKRSKATVPLVLGAILAAGAAGAWWFVRQPAAGTGPGQNATGQVLHPEQSPAIPALPPPAAGVERRERPERPEKPEGPEASSPVPALPPQPAPAAPTVTVHDGLPLSITLANDIPADAAAGTAIHLTVAKEFEAGEGASIPKGALVKGEIAQEGKKKFLGLGGKLMFRLLTVEIADGQSLKVRATPTKRENGQLWRPVDVPGRTRPKGVAAVAGTQYVAYIDGDQTLPARK